MSTKKREKFLAVFLLKVIKTEGRGSSYKFIFFWLHPLGCASILATSLFCFALFFVLHSLLSTETGGMGRGILPAIIATFLPLFFFYSYKRSLKEK